MSEVPLCCRPVSRALWRSYGGGGFLRARWPCRTVPLQDLAHKKISVCRVASLTLGIGLQGYLAHKKSSPPRTLRYRGTSLIRDRPPP